MIDQVSHIIREAAEQEILPRFRQLTEGQVRTKAHGDDFVTDADLGAERLLTRRLSELLPGSLVVGEEAVYQDRAILKRLEQDAPVWVIDPLDGTGNFTRESECFGVIVALVQGGRTRAGWLHDPVRNLTATAEEGSGARLDGALLSLRNERPLADMRLQAGPAIPDDVRSMVKCIERPKCAAQMYLSLVEGRAEVVVFRRLQPWDHAAGVLIHREAGGVSGQILDGGPYKPVMSEQGLIMAPDKDTWEALAEPLRRDFRSRCPTC